MFSKVLIANRGAIAVRIERTLAKMGVKSVAVYSKADRDSLHVENADEAVYLGEGTAKDTYLDVDKIIKAALDTGADMKATLDGESVPMYTVISASPMQELKFKTAAKGMRTYLLVKGGIDVPKIMGSSSTFCDGKFGGHNGRALRTGDVLHIAEDCQADNFNSLDGKTECTLVSV